MRQFLSKYVIMSCFLAQAIAAQSQTYAQPGQFQLATPEISSEAIFFKDQTSVEIDLDIDGVTIRYTTDGTVPTKASALYLDKINLNKSSQIKAKAWHDDFLPSEVMGLSVRKLDAKNNIRLAVNPGPSESYPGKGAEGLVDQVKGSANFRDGHWLGFSVDTITMEIEFAEAIDVPIVNLSVLEDQGSWIFLPASVEVWVGGEQVTLWEKDRMQDQPKSFQYIQFTIPRRKLKEAVIKIVMDTIPKWHAGVGTVPWFFMDEVFIQK